MTVRTARRTKAKLDREQVIDAALRLADDDDGGLEAISFRRLADQFGVTPMALYWHFEDKDALLGALADRIWSRAAAELEQGLARTPALDGWGKLRLIAQALVDAMRPHPAVAELVPSRVVSCEAGLGVTELALGLLADEGFDPALAADLARFVLSSAVMLVSTQAGVEIADPSERPEHQRRKRIALASLPLDRYPHIIASAEHLTDCESPDAWFTRGLNAIIDGVRAQAPS